MSAVPAPAGAPFACASGASLGARDEQQDASRFRQLPDGSLLMVLADGMGGHAGGALAARVAAEACLAEIPPALAGGASPGEAMMAALSRANGLMARLMAGDPALSRMGATLVAALASTAGLTWVSVGDSPMWLCRDGVLTRLNEDHSIPSRDGGKGNMLSSVVNGDPPSEVDVRDEPFPLRAGDRIVLASDGLLTLEEPEVAGIASSAPDCGSAVGALLAAVEGRARPRQDNCTVVMAELRAAGAAVPAVRRALPPAGRATLLLALAGFALGVATPLALYALAG